MCARLSSKLSAPWLKKRISLNEPVTPPSAEARPGSTMISVFYELADLLERVEDPPKWW